MAVYGGLWLDMQAKFQQEAIDFLKVHGPYTIRMERFAPEIKKGRWPWSKPRPTGSYNTEVSTAIPAELVKVNDLRYEIRPTDPDARWLWEGEGSFQAFVVYSAEGELLMRGGHLPCTPTPGSLVTPKRITIDLATPEEMLQ